MTVRILIGDARERLKEIPDCSVHCCVTSPPFWRQRNYEREGQLGVERTPAEYVSHMVVVMREVRRVLIPDGVLLMELGDTYAAGGNGGGGSRAAKRKKLESLQQRTGWRSPPPGYKERDLTLTPFLVADALRADGWYLRKVIIWDKGTATEPPRRDRPSVSHSYVFLLSKREQSQVRDPGEGWFQSSVWTIPPSASGTDHPAPMAPELARRLILMSCPPDGTVIDPFFGGGTTGMVADRLSRHCIGIELNDGYAAAAQARLNSDGGMFMEVQAA